LGEFGLGVMGKGFCPGGGGRVREVRRSFTTGRYDCSPKKHNFWRHSITGVSDFSKKIRLGRFAGKNNRAYGFALG